MQTEWNSNDLTRSKGWRRAEWAMFIVACSLLAYTAYAYTYERDPGADRRMLMLGAALVAMTATPLVPARVPAVRWSLLAVAVLLLVGALRA